MDDPRERARAYVLRQLARCKAEFERQGADGLTLNPLARRRFAPSNATISRLFADPPLVRWGMLAGAMGRMAGWWRLPRRSLG